MKKQICWQEVLLKLIKFFFIFNFYLILIIPTNALSKERWRIDENLSKISFEIPVLLLNNVKGNFSSIEGYVEIDLENNKNNKAVFSVDIDSIKINYEKYIDLLMSDIFFNQKQFSKAVIDTKKFSYKNEEEIVINVELMIKGKSQILPIIIKVKKIAEKIVQVQSELIFSRTSFNIGIGKWSNTAVLKDNAKLRANLFLFKE